MAKEVIVYTQPNCSACKTAMQFLSQNGISYVAKDISTDEQARSELVALGSQATPTIKVGSEVLIGFNPRKLAAALEI